MSSHPTLKAATYAWAVTVLLFVALVARLPELAVLAAPFLASLLIDMARPRPSRPVLDFDLKPARVVEGDPVTCEISLGGLRRGDRVEVALGLPVGLRPAVGNGTAVSFTATETDRNVTIEVLPDRFGSYTVGPLAWGVRSPADLELAEGVETTGRRLRVLPSRERLRTLVSPREVRALVGSRTSRLAGQGLEFADVRPMVPADPARAINWRLSALRETPFVNLRHPEHNGDVVLFVDAFSEHAIDGSVRLAATLAAAYSAARDRVGVLGFGGIVRFVPPGLGVRHLYRVMDLLITATAEASFVERNLTHVPRRSLPPGALVIAITALEDERVRNSLTALARQGVDLAVLVMPIDETVAPTDRDGRLASRIWRLERWSATAALERHGVVVLPVSTGRSVESLLSELERWRRRRR